METTEQIIPQLDREVGRMIEDPIEDVYVYDISINMASVNDANLFDTEFFKMTELGLFVGVRDSYRGYESHNSIHKKDEALCENKNFDTATLQDKSIYRFPKLSLPREKLKVISEKYNTKVIRDYKQADLLVVSTKYLDSLYDHGWGSINYKTVQDLKDWFLMYGGTHWSKVYSVECHDQMISFLDSCPDNTVFVLTKPYYYHNDKITAAQRDLLDSIKSESNRGYAYYVKNAFIDSYKYLLQNKDKVVFDSTLSKISTEDSVALNEETFKQVLKMILSDDLDDTTLALEIMANCNVEESYEYISLLLYFYTDTMKNSKGWNHVNFKTIRTKFGAYVTGSPHWGHAWPYDDITKKLCQDGHLTEFAVQVISNEMYKKVLNQTFGIEASGVFKIDPSVLVLKEEYQKQLKMTDIKCPPKDSFGDDLPF